MQNLSYLNIFFNSININNRSPESYAFYEKTSKGHINIENNIFSNTGYGYAYYVSTPNQISKSDYNNYYSPISKLIYWGTDYYSINSLNAISGKDSSSMIVPPFFASQSDLHCHQALLYGEGCDMAGITTDIDSDPRNVPPSIGADEVTISAIDCGVSSIISPLDSVIIQSTQAISLYINNYGMDTLTSIPVAFVPNSGETPIIETWTGVLLPGQSVNFTFSSTYSPTLGSTNTYCYAYTLLATDQININDTAFKTVFVSDIKDCGIKSIISPVALVSDNSVYPVTVVIKNYGTKSLSYIPLSYSLGAPNPTINYSWSGTLSPGDTTVFTFTSDPITVTNSNGFDLCVFTSMSYDYNHSNDTICMSVLIDKINEPELDNDMSVFPNPADEYVVLKFLSQSNGKGIVSVSSLDGRIVQNTEVYINNGENQIRMETGELQSGVYYITILKKEICFGNAILVIE